MIRVTPSLASSAWLECSEQTLLLNCGKAEDAHGASRLWFVCSLSKGVQPDSSILSHPELHGLMRIMLLREFIQNDCATELALQILCNIKPQDSEESLALLQVILGFSHESRQ